jgi:glycosyltransferase involved in cell wall biosynthesis
MAAGVAVITSDNSSLPEVAGEGALLIDPRSVSELGSALERVLGSESLRRDLAARGQEKARGYRWDECARRSLEFFREVAG